MTISVFLADDQPLIRLGLRNLLEAEREFRIVGESGDGLQTVRLVGRLKPAVLVINTMMPGLNGLGVLKRLKDRSPQT